MTQITQHVHNILQEVSAKGALVVAVSKKKSLGDINEALEAGITHIGENYLQEAQEKLPSLPDNITKHFIGQLQKNKIKHIVPLFDVIQSVDSIEKLQKIEEISQKNHKKMDVCIQVNISNEQQKSGVNFDNIQSLLEVVENFQYVTIKGFMALTLHTTDEHTIRNQMRALRSAFESYKRMSFKNVDLIWLSMGMTNDYHIALEEGANMVRIGRKIFGERA